MTDREEQLTVQLAGCGAAALGATRRPAKRGDWGWSPAYQSVLDLRRAFDRLYRKHFGASPHRKDSERGERSKPKRIDPSRTVRKRSTKGACR